MTLVVLVFHVPIMRERRIRVNHFNQLQRPRCFSRIYFQAGLLSLSDISFIGVTVKDILCT